MKVYGQFQSELRRRKLEGFTMVTHTVSSLELARDPSGTTRLAIEGPVFITERGKPQFVLLTIDDYDKLGGSFHEASLLELVNSMPRTDGIDYEPSQVAVELGAPETVVDMPITEMSKEMPNAFPLKKTEHDFEWLHHTFTLDWNKEAKDIGARLASYSLRGAAILDVNADRFVIVNFRKFYDASPMEQVCIVKRGINARLVDVLATLMQISTEKLIDTLGLASATIRRKSRQQMALSCDESSRVMGVSKLIGQAQAMVEESGAPEDFDVAAWFAQWLDQPLPALDGGHPRDLMDTAEGQAVLSQMLRRLQSAAYA